MKKSIALKPAGSLNNHTGSWRLTRPIVDFKTCIGCSLCAKICPDGCIDMVSHGGKLKSHINYDYCKGCNLCVKECPVKAISSIPEKE
ncbi:MAG TPA: 4Fe-4S binding protein [bacterium]|nr:4Fe-4S binding protein [bacterium]HPT29743.1 4Fe-4S binding protein [bacterium]